MTSVVWETGSPEETLARGEQLGRLLVAGDVLGLVGPLGAGKTVLAKGVARGMQIDPDDVASPAFTLLERHPAPVPLYHGDLFRLGSPDELDTLDLAGAEDGVLMLEWFDRFAGALPPETLRVTIGEEGDERRRIVVEARGTRGETLVMKLRCVPP